VIYLYIITSRKTDEVLAISKAIDFSVKEFVRLVAEKSFFPYRLIRIYQVENVPDLNNERYYYDDTNGFYHKKYNLIDSQIEQIEQDYRDKLAAEVATE